MEAAAKKSSPSSSTTSCIKAACPQGAAGRKVTDDSLTADEMHKMTVPTISGVSVVPTHLL